MKKLVLLVLLCTTINAFSQLQNKKSLEKQAEEVYANDFLTGAETIKADYSLTSSGITLQTIVEVPEKNKAEIFKMLKEHLSTITGNHLAYESDEDCIIDITSMFANFGEQVTSKQSYAFLYLPGTLRFVAGDGKVTISCSFRGYAGEEIVKQKKKKNILGKIAGVASSVGALGIAGGAIGGATSVVTSGAKIVNLGAMAGAASSIQNIVTGTGGSSSMPSIAAVDYEIRDSYPYKEDDENKEISAKLLCMSMIGAQNALSQMTEDINKIFN